MGIKDKILGKVGQLFICANRGCNTQWRGSAKSKCPNCNSEAQ